MSRFTQKYIPRRSAPKSTTVRTAFAFPIFLTVAALLGAAVMDTQNKTYIHIDSPQAVVKEGDTFKINVYVSAHIPINAVDISLDFPSSEVEVLGIDTGESVLTLWTQDPYVEDSSVILRGGTFRKGFLGDHLIASINVRAKTSGLATFSIGDSKLLAGDGSGTEVPIADITDAHTKLYIANKDGSFFIQDQGIGDSLAVHILTDIDGDGSVSLTDLSRFMTAWTKRTEIFDFSGDGRMTFKDFGIILSDTFFK